MSAIETNRRAGRYLTFDLNGEQYGVDAMRVVAIIGAQDSTPLPRAPSHVKGLTMVRGKVVPVIDVRLRLGMMEQVRTPETCIILLEKGIGQVGIIVDMVRDVVAFVEEEFEDLHEGIDSDGIVGIAKKDKAIVTILDVDETTSF